MKRYTIHYTYTEGNDTQVSRSFQSVFTLREAKKFLKEEAAQITQYETATMNRDNTRLSIYCGDTVRQYKIIQF